MARSRKKGADRQKLTGREVRRYVLLLLAPCVIFFVAVAVLVADALPEDFFQGTGSKKSVPQVSSETGEETAEPEPEPEPDTKQYIQDFGGSILSQDTVPEINQLMEQYFLSISECDMPTFLHLFTSQDTGGEEQFRRQFEQQSAYIDGYQNISCYTAPGLSEGDYMVYVSYEIRYKGVETPAPSLVYVYAARCEDGQYRIYDGEMTKELAAFQERIFVNEDVRLLIHQIDRKLEEAAAADPALRERMDFMKNGPDYMQD
ncbi:hypothetical protein D3Z50_00965 [Clostridiaceae bacterium]|nr:hypothetical protein [Clostridium sp.]NBI69655.1 hypothetical protein [Clostridiaceae bacterium]